MRLFATCDLGPALQRLRDKGWELDVWTRVEPPPPEVIVDEAGRVDALLTTLRDAIGEPVFAAGAAGRLKIVAQMAVGFDNIDRAAANRHRIPFTNTPDVLTDATAELAFFIMGAAARRTWPSEQMVRERTWSQWHPSLPWLGVEVTGKTVAVVGVGRIGRSFVQKAVGFDMDVLCCGRGAPDAAFLASVRRVMAVRYEEGLARRRRTIEWLPLDDALARADFVSLHVSLTRPGQAAEPTYHLIDERRLRLMNPDAILVNTARGAVVDEAALARALREGWIGGAALDVFEREPLPADSPLRDEALASKLRLFSHIGSAAEATRLSSDPDVGMAGRTVQAVIDRLEDRYGGDPKAMPFVVNKEAF
jgi:glyoxylate reductase